jgi:putative hydrolase of the HAD superfamily
MLKAVIFDFGNVICRFDTGRFLADLAARTDMPVEEMKAAVYGSDLPARYETGLVSSEGFFREVVRRCRLSIGREEFIAAFTGIFTPIPSTFRLIPELKKTCAVGLLSNTNDWHFEHYIRRTSVFPLFDAVTLSYRVKAMKPRRAIYADALEKIGKDPGECVYIDDIEEYVEGARRLGMVGIRFDRPEDVRASLRAEGVLP